MKSLRISAVALAMAGAAVGVSAQAAVTASFEAPGVTATSMSGYQLGVENLDNTANGGANLVFAGTSITGTTSGFINIGQANIYGGAGGTGSFGTVNSDATIQLSQAVNYFGIWGSALDGQNSVALYSGDALLATYALQSLLESSPNFSNAYRGNPSGGGDSGEDFAFFNFKSDVAFDKVKLIENGGGGFEFDNLTVGVVSAAPEPSTWAMLLLGFGMIGRTLRSRRRPDFAVA